MIRSLGAMRNVWHIPELKNKIIYTLALLTIYRLGAHVPAPFIDRAKLTEQLSQASQSNPLFQVVSLFSGHAFQQMSVFALGIMPYISISIILQLMTVVVPRLQKLKEEGAVGQRKINRWTRQGTILLAIFQGFGVGFYLINSQLTNMTEGTNRLIFLVSVTACMTAGTAFLMWLGERITERGIGNGISMIIAVGILAHYPTDIITIGQQVASGSISAIWPVAIVVMFVVSVMAIIYVQEGTRRIPIQQAKHTVGRKQTMGGTNYLPLKINPAGVIPVIFASALLSFPGFFTTFSGGQQGFFSNLFSPNSPYNLYSAMQSIMPSFQAEGIFLLLKSINVHHMGFMVLTFIFAFFYTAVILNPDELANNLKKQGAYVPGISPGKKTSDHIDYVMTRVVAVGAAYITLIATLPLFLETSFKMPHQAVSFVGGTGLIIVIGVFLETLKQIESQLLMRHYDGFAKRRTSAARWR